jgi:hypothetical protein
MKRFFKKGNGTIIEANANHDIKSLEDRFEECDENGGEIKKVVKKVAKKAKKEGK